MTVITNRYSLPESYWRACAEQRVYTPGRISVTELIQPPQLRALRLRHDAELEQDCADMIDLFFGTAVHERLEKFADSRSLAEEKLVVRDQETGWYVHGTPDLAEWAGWTQAGELIDWKTTRVRALRYDRIEWEQQVNLYAHLLRLSGYGIGTLTVWAFLKDYDPQKRREDGYPAHALVKIPMPLWSHAYAQAAMVKRLRLHKLALEQGIYGSCTDEERWKRDQWAVRPVDGKRAVSGGIFNDQRMATEYAAALVERPRRWQDWYRVEQRHGNPIRCQSYCPVSAFCAQWQAERPDTLEEQLEASVATEA